MNREDILNEAIQCVCNDRQDAYGNPEDCFSIIAEYWSTYICSRCLMRDRDDELINSEDVAAMMILLKVARLSKGKPKADNWVDIAGYAGCGGELEGSFQHGKN